jgi:hypothetical protein
MVLLRVRYAGVIFDFRAIDFGVGATEVPCVGGSIPPLATTSFSCIQAGFRAGLMRFWGALCRKSARRSGPATSVGEGSGAVAGRGWRWREA